MTAAATIGRWLSIIGLGEQGLDGLSRTALQLLRQATFIIGGARHVAMVGPTESEVMSWPTPFERGIDEIRARRGSAVCVLASGDPFFYGVGSVLSSVVSPDEMVCVPAASALSIAAARMGWALQDCAVVALHGRPFERVIPHLRPGARVFVLSWDGKTPQKLARLLTERGLGACRMVVLEALGGPREKVRQARACDFDVSEIDALNIVAVEIEPALRARFIPLMGGLSDAWFESDGQITKREIRAVTMSSLAPWPGARLWDIGAGAGSVAIEWMLAHPRNGACAIEARADRAARIARNAAALGVPDITIVNGSAPGALAGLPAPDAIFVGGGGADVIDAAWNSLRVEGRLVVNAVTLETQHALFERQCRFGGELLSIATAHLSELGRFSAWRPAMPVVQWSVVKD